MQVIPENEWRKIQSMKPAVLDRVCKKVLDSLQDLIVISATDQIHHEHYLNIHKWLVDRDKEIAKGFNGLRRSNAYFLVAFWIKNLWVTQKEFDMLSEDTRAKVLFLSGLNEYSPPK